MGESNEDNTQGVEKQNLLPGGMVLSIFVMLCRVPNNITDIDGGWIRENIFKCFQELIYVLEAGDDSWGMDICDAF